MIMAPAVSVQSVRKTFGLNLFKRRKPPVLQDVSFAVARGEVFGIVGPNGAGKTTLIKLLLSIARPTSGVIEVLGDTPEEPRVRARIGYLPERLAMPFSMTPRQYLEEVGRIKRLSNREADVLCQLDRVGVRQVSSSKLGTLSKGVKQRVGLAVALLGRPELLILDEPTDGFDPLGRIDFREILRQEHERGATIVINSHLLAEAERICDSVMILKDGQVVSRGQVSELCCLEDGWLIRFAEPPSAADASAAGFIIGTTSDVYTFAEPSPRALSVGLSSLLLGGAQVVAVERRQRLLEEIFVNVVRR